MEFRLGRSYGRRPDSCLKGVIILLHGYKNGTHKGSFPFGPRGGSLTPEDFKHVKHDSLDFFVVACQCKDNGGYEDKVNHEKDSYVGSRKGHELGR